MSFDAANVTLNITAREKLRLLVSRIENLAEQRAEIIAQIQDVYGEAKALGYDTTALRKVVSERQKDRREREEQEAILDVYMMALGEI